MPIIEIVFYLFGAILILSALAVVLVGNPVHAALFLVLAFFSAACIWLLLQVEFLAIVLVLVYVGAVMVLFLFVVMMLDVKAAPNKEGFTRFMPIGLFVAAAMALQMFFVIWTRGLQSVPMPAPRAQDYSHTREIVQERLPAELMQAVADLHNEVTQLQARITRIEQFLEMVSAEYRKRAEAA